MIPLEKQLRRSKLGPAAILGGALVSVLLFVAMGLTQLRIDFDPPPETLPVQDFYLPPPPPPPAKKQEAEQQPLAISIGIDPEPGAEGVPLGFLDVDFGLKPRELTSGQFDSIETLDAYAAENLEDLSVYDYQDVSEKPKRTYEPRLTLEARDIDRTKKAFSFVVFCRITQSGRTENIHIIDCPYPQAIPDIIRWVDAMRYEPAKKDGKPVDCLIQVRITYNPAGGGSPFSI